MSATRPKFDQLNIVSANPEASLEFYRRLGVEIPEQAIWRTRTGIHHASVRGTADDAPDLDIDSIAFAKKWNSGWDGREDLKGCVVVGFHVSSRSDVDELYIKMTKAGYAGLQSPYDAIWGARYAVLEDPDGIAVGLMSPVSPELRSKPPEV
ncbi:MAG TPA: VOC family protein [Bryobacteraceae bacterium]|jgi:uncharacterized glyoxalase superfamily protein PhnB